MVDQSFISADPSTSGSDLCLSCGFCCDGTLHGKTGVKPADSISLLVKIGFVPVTGRAGEVTGFAQPCPQFHGKCSIYHDIRPSVCGTYQCALLKSVEKGECAPEEALRIVREAKILRDALPAELDRMMAEANPGYKGRTILSHLNCLLPLLFDPKAIPFRDKYLDRAAAVIRFGTHLKKYFVTSADK